MSTNKAWGRAWKALPWILLGAATFFAIVNLVLGLTRPSLRNFPSQSYVDVAFVVAFWLFSPVGAVIASRVPRSPIGWVMLGIGFFETAGGALNEYSIRAVFLDRSLPAGQFTSTLSLFIWSPGLALMPILMLLFPSGRFLSRRWRVLAVPPIAAVAIFAVIAAVQSDSALEVMSNPEIIAVDPTINRIAEVAAFGMFGTLVGSMIGFIIRFRRSSGLEHQQLKWLAYPVGVAAFLIVINIFLAEPLGFDRTAFGQVAEFFLNIAAMAIPVAIGIAILRHRLFDIDVIINKTLVYGVLAALITAFYLGVVIGIGTALGRESNLPLSIAATAVIAIAIQPLRRRLQSLGNRLVYGQRVTPYEAMSEFSRQMAAAPTLDEVLPEIAEVAATGIGASKAHVNVLLADGSTRVAQWPPESSAESDDLLVPIMHRGERVGVIGVSKPRGESITATEENLINDLAAQAGPTLRNVRLTEELRASRQRLVATQDEERRRMERDLHDGAQQQLVSLSVKLGLTKSLLRRDLDKAEGLIDQLKIEAGETVETLRDLARGLFPQVLVDEGLAQAIDSHVRKSGIPAELQSNLNGRRYDLKDEAAVYFVIREALQNASKHAGTTTITVAVEGKEDELAFEVRDRGPGFDPQKIKSGSGLQNMRDRLEALGGDFEIESSPGTGTSVKGRIPSAAMKAEL